MRVLITGGTGFVGSHTAAAVIRAGHAVRLLARQPEWARAALAPFGLAAQEVMAGDVLDPASVRAAVAGCDAVINAAGVYALDPRRARSVLATNARATEVVLAAAAAARLDPIVHVSSYVALLPSREVLTPGSPAGTAGPAYPRSKAASERIARRYQEDGAPVVVTYPGAVAGPDDPYFGDTDFTLAMILRDRMPFALPGGWAVADVRYVAEGHAAMLEPGRGPRRYFLGGHFTSWEDMFAELRRLTGRRLPAVPTPGWAARASGRAMDALQRAAWTRLPLGYTGPWIITRCAGTDDAATRRELGVAPPPLEQTLADTIRWLVRAGHLPARLAGQLSLAGEHPAGPAAEPAGQPARPAA